MRRLFVALTSAVGVVAFTHMASAADVYQPVYKAAPPPAPVSGWAGWYVGVNAGASFGNAKTDFDAAPGTVVLSGPITGTIPGFAGSNTLYPDGFIGGGQIGYNWQFSPIWVVGLEADFQGALEKESASFSPNDAIFTIGGSTAVRLADANYATKIEWFGTVRGRIGYVWGDGNVMSYLTGGLAYGKVDVEGTTSTAAADVPFAITQSFGHSHVNTGWVVGYGTEGKLLIPGWSWKVEGLWMDLGTLDDAASGVFHSLGNGASVTVGPFTTHTRFTDGILRGGLNYHF